MATIGDVARRAGVSTTLVSRYLNGVKGVGPASKEKIESAIRELNYVPDESARMLVRRRGGASPEGDVSAAGTAAPRLPAVAILCEDVDPQLASALYVGIKRAIRANASYSDHHLLLFCAMPGEERAEDETAAFTYIKDACKGLLCFGSGEGNALYDRLQSAELPSVYVTPTFEAPVLHKGTRELKDAIDALGRATALFTEKLFGQMEAQSTSVIWEHVEHSFFISEEEEKPRPGRGLQSHLL